MGNIGFGFAPEQRALEVWDDKPGGRVIERWTTDGVKYVMVEFDNSPGEHYVYFAE